MKANPKFVLFLGGTILVFGALWLNGQLDTHPIVKSSYVASYKEIELDPLTKRRQQDLIAEAKNGKSKSINLETADFRGADLVEISLNNANLRNAVLRGANLKNASLANADLQRADLRGTNLYKSDLRGANLNKTVFRKVNLYGADLREAVLQSVDAKDVNLTDANLQGANLSGSKGFTETQLSTVKTLYGAKLPMDIEKQLREKYPHLFSPG